MKLLVVEDEKGMSRALAKGLTKRGYAVDCAFNGEDAIHLYGLNEYDLMVLDINLPKINGLEVLRRIREKDPYFRVLILSARSSIEDRVAGLDQGASDYLTKPFDFRELEARIRGLLRREFLQKDAELYCGGLKLDTVGKTVSFRGRPLSLTKKEYGILEYLLTQNRMVSAEELIEHVWNSDADLFSNTFKFHISSLRKKLAEAAGESVAIITLRNQGYRITAKEEQI